MMEKVPATYEEYALDKKQRLIFFMIAAAAIFIIAFLFYKSVILSAIAMLCCIPLEKYYKSYLAVKRKQLLNYQFRDALYSISASVAAGRQLPEAVLEASENMKVIYAENAMITRELSHIAACIYECRESEEEILIDFAKRSGLEDIRQFVDVYFTCRKTGGDLEKVVMKAADIIVDKITIDREIQTLTAQKRFEAKLLTAIPLVVVLFLQLVSPEYLAVMYETLIGRLIMTGAMAAITGAYLLSVKITDIKV